MATTRGGGDAAESSSAVAAGSSQKKVLKVKVQHGLNAIGDIGQVTVKLRPPFQLKTYLARIANAVNEKAPSVAFRYRDGDEWLTLQDEDDWEDFLEAEEQVIRVVPPPAPVAIATHAASPI